VLYTLIRSFANKKTELLYISGKSSHFRVSIFGVAVRKLDYLNAAKTLNDLRMPPGNRLEKLKGNFIGKHSIRINDQYRIVFRFEQSDAYEVEIIDYHK